jgi:peptidoglycan/xylan/chitin deacetylase (PgdA/CDA1 family)
MKTYPTKPTVILSFDDGYIDFYQNVLPILKSLKIKCNHNICPGLIENSIPPWTQILSLYLSLKTSENERFNTTLKIDNSVIYDEKKFIELCKRMLQLEDKLRSELILPLLNHIPKSKVYKLMNWDQIKECSESQIEIGSHGNMHRNLLKIWEEEILEDEIKMSSKKIESKIGIKPKVFAFANAIGNEESKKYVINSGYNFVLIQMDKFLKWRPLKSDSNLEVPRINISRSDWREEYLRAFGFHVYLKQFF